MSAASTVSNGTRFLSLSAMADGSLLRDAVFEGITYVVVPIVSAVGDKVWWPANAPTPELVPADVLAAHAFTRNNRPIVMGHPKVSGDYCSANSPQILERYGFGHMFAAEYSNQRIKVEAWLDPLRAAQVGPDATKVIQRLQAGEQVEVSEGNYVVTVIESGTIDGKNYGARWLSAVSDHLAMLPEGVEGACSVTMGCGGPRVAVLRESNQMAVNSFNPAAPTAPKSTTSKLIASKLSQAHTPKYTGTESTSWSKPSFADYVKYLDNSDSPPSSVAQCSSELKAKIAAHTLLGDPDASSFGDLSVFPVVNPANDKLNERALRAVLGGRGSSADISDSALASAQEIARRLLNSEFSTNIKSSEVSMAAQKKNLIQRMMSALRSSLSNNDIQWNLYRALIDANQGVAFVEDYDLDAKTVIFCVIITFGDYYDADVQYHYYKRGFEIDAEGNITISSEPAVEVEFDSITQWKPVATAIVVPDLTDPDVTVVDISASAASSSCSCHQPKEGDRMSDSRDSQKDLVTKLIASSKAPFDETDRKALEGLSGTKLKALMASFGEEPKGDKPVDNSGTITAASAGAVTTGEPTAATPAPSATSSASAETVTLTSSEYASLKSAADVLHKQEQEWRAQVITGLTAAQSGFTAEDLQAFNSDVLSKLATSFKLNEAPKADFSVRGIARPGVVVSSADAMKQHEPKDYWAAALKASEEKAKSKAN